MDRRRSRFAKLTDDPDRERQRDRDRDRDRNEGRRHERPFLNGPMKMGLAALGIGIVLTVVTYSAADSNNGSYFVFRGAIIVGIVQIVRGLLTRGER